MHLFKKYMSVLTAVMLLFCVNACKNEDEGELAPWFRFTNSNGVVFPSLNEVDFGAHEYVMNVYTNINWEVTSDAEWLYATPDKRLGCVQGKIIIKENTVEEERTGTITVRSENPKLPVHTIVFHQSAAPHKVEKLFIAPEKKGTGDGWTWENAMGAKELETLLSDATDLSEISIYLSEGTFNITAGTNITKKVKSIEGGYTPEGEPSSNPTILTFGTKPSALTSMFRMNENAEVTFKNCIFDGGYNETEKGYGRAFEIRHKTALLQLTECDIQHFSVRGTDSGDHSGAAIFVTEGAFRLNKVNITHNVVHQRGVIYLNVDGDRYGYGFMNNVLIADNISESWWGVAIHAKKALCMNNVTICNNTNGGNGNHATINGSGSFFIANTTVIAQNPTVETTWSNFGAFRCETDVSKGESAVIINSIFGNDTDDGLTMTDSGSGASFKSGGWCLYGKTQNWLVSQQATTDTSYTDQAIAKLGKYEDGAFQWNPTAINTLQFAKYADILKAAKEFTPASIPTLGQDFVNWMGEEAFGLDGKGNSRNPNKMLPGAYDTGLQ